MKNRNLKIEGKKAWDKHTVPDSIKGTGLMGMAIYYFRLGALNERKFLNLTMNDLKHPLPIGKQFELFLRKTGQLKNNIKYSKKEYREAAKKAVKNSK